LVRADSLGILTLTKTRKPNARNMVQDLSFAVLMTPPWRRPGLLIHASDSRPATI